jgi:hypothetical protein
MSPAERRKSETGPQPEVEVIWRVSEDADRLRRLAALLFESRPGDASGDPVVPRDHRRVQAAAADSNRKRRADG